MTRSLGFLGSSHGSDTGILLGNFLIQGFVLEVSVVGADVVLLSHLKVLPEVLVSAPPVGMDHAQTLVSADLMEVSVPDVVLMSVSRHTSVGVSGTVLVVHLSNVPSPLLAHRLLLVFADDVEEEGLVEVVTHEHPDKSDSVVGAVGLGLPVSVSHRVLEESSDILEGSPSLGLVSRFLLGVNELGEVTVGFLSKSSKESNQML